MPCLRQTPYQGRHAHSLQAAFQPRLQLRSLVHFQGGAKATETVINRLLMVAVADVSRGVRHTVLAALVENGDLDAHLAQSDWCALVSVQWFMKPLRVSRGETWIVLSDARQPALRKIN